MTTKKKTVPQADAKLPGPSKTDNGEELVTLTNQQLATIIANPDYANEQAVQAAVKPVQVAATALDGTNVKLAQARAAIAPLEATRSTQIATLKRGRRNLAASITVVCAGDSAAIKSWGTVPQTTATVAATNAAPLELAVKANQATSGLINCKCLPVPGAGAYLWIVLSDPAAPPASAVPLMTTKSRVGIPGQPVGHVVYVRVAVVRPRGGQSTWSDAVGVTVR